MQDSRSRICNVAVEKLTRVLFSEKSIGYYFRFPAPIRGADHLETNANYGVHHVDFLIMDEVYTAEGFHTLFLILFQKTGC